VEFGLGEASESSERAHIGTFRARLPCRGRYRATTPRAMCDPANKQVYFCGYSKSVPSLRSVLVTGLPTQAV
jgi:hypothetical protein